MFSKWDVEEIRETVESVTSSLPEVTLMENGMSIRIFFRTSPFPSYEQQKSLVTALTMYGDIKTNSVPGSFVSFVIFK